MVRPEYIVYLVTDFGADLIVGRATRIDTKEKQVFTADGHAYPYNLLVLATGARPLIPPIPGVDGGNIAPVRSLDDLIDYQYATHPELAAKPSHNIYIFAAMEALRNC